MKIEYDNKLDIEKINNLEDEFSSLEFIELTTGFEEVAINSNDYIGDNFNNWLENEIITNGYVLSYNKGREKFYLT